jgi:predicted branched-subunit amino acid permease
MTKKIRIKFRNLKREWNGYYYFALSDKEFARILAQKKKNHRKNIYIFS